MDFPRTVEEITPEWLTQVLRESGSISNSVVESLVLEEVGGQGNWSEVRRLVPEYSAKEPDSPRSMVVKIGLQTEEITQNPVIRHELAVVNEREARFYQDLAANCGLNTPKHYFSAYDLGTAEAMYVLGDIGHLRAVDRVDGCSFDDGRAVLLSLANMHRTWWENEHLSEQPWIRDYGTNARPQVVQQWFEQRIDSFFEMSGNNIPKGLESIARKFLPKLVDVTQEIVTAPVTLSHGDFQLSNMVFDDSLDIENRIVVFDWQSPGLIRCSEDVATFMSTSFDVASRREYEQQLLAEYHSVLLEGGVTNYSHDQFLYDVRLSLLVSMAKLINSVARKPEAAQASEEVRVRDMALVERLQTMVDWNCDEVIPK